MAEAFQWAITTGDLNGVRDFVETKKHDVNAADATVKRRTPLHYAADFGQRTLDLNFARSRSVSPLRL